jgi:protein phosphatase
VKSFGLTDKGAVRKDNQDCFILEKCESKGCLIAALCDGMGGAKAGGIASQLANKAFVSYIYTKLDSTLRRNLDYKRILEDACAEANGVSYEYSHFDREFDGMGTTIVGGVIKSNGNGHIINVGDSRAYLISLRVSEIRQITRDHSLVGELVAAGAITPEQARNHPRKNVLTRALGSDPHVECDYYSFALAGGDLLLLCSDGLSNIVSDLEMLSCAKEFREPESLCRALMTKALNRGAKDNVTVVAVTR